MPSTDELIRRSLTTLIRRSERFGLVRETRHPVHGARGDDFDPRNNARFNDQTGVSIPGLETWDPDLEGN